MSRNSKELWRQSNINIPFLVGALSVFATEGFRPLLAGFFISSSSSLCSDSDDSLLLPLSSLSDATTVFLTVPRGRPGPFFFGWGSGVKSCNTDARSTTNPSSREMGRMLTHPSLHLHKSLLNTRNFHDNSSS